MNFLNGLACFMAFQLLGEAISLYFMLPIPGPVIGLLMLFALLLIIGKQNAALNHSADVILKHLSLLFVPAGVGLMTLFSQLQGQWLTMLVVIVAGAIITMLSTAVIMALVNKLIGVDK